MASFSFIVSFHLCSTELYFSAVCKRSLLVKIPSQRLVYCLQSFFWFNVCVFIEYDSTIGQKCCKLLIYTDIHTYKCIHDLIYAQLHIYISISLVYSKLHLSIEFEIIFLVVVALNLYLVLYFVDD